MNYRPAAGMSGPTWRYPDANHTLQAACQPKDDSLYLRLNDKPTVRELAHGSGT